MTNIDDFLNILDKLYPNAKCELNYHNSYELLIAVSLSAQTTDKRVNQITPILFKKYRDAYALATAKEKDIAEIIKPLGLYHHKAKYIITLANQLCTNFNGIVPENRADLETLKGVGRKTANVILAEAFNIPTLAVDTHVARVAVRMGFAESNDSILEIERKLTALIPKDKWAKAHLEILYFGRYLCKAKKPLCIQCPFQSECLYFKTI